MTNERLQIGYLEVQNRPTVNGVGVLLQGEAAGGSVENVVYTTGNQTVTGLKSFSDVSVTNKLTFRNAEISWGGLGSGVYFSQPNNSATQIIDYIDTDLSITRGNVQGIYNAELENSWDENGNGGPDGTVWNKDGYDDLSNVADRTFDSLIDIFNNQIGNNIVGSPLVMRDTTNDKYYKILFDNWQQGGADTDTYAGFSYTRWLIVDPTYPYPAVSGEKLNFKNKTEFDIRPIVNGTGVLLSGEAAKFTLPNTVVYTTGNQAIDGNKDFYGDEVIFSGTNVVFTENTGTVNGDWRFGRRPTVNGTGVLLSGEAGNLPTTIVYRTGDQIISGNKSFYGDILLSGTNNRIGKSQYIETDNDFVYIRQAGGNIILSSEEYVLFDDQQSPSVLWDNRVLNDSLGQPALDWNNRNLINKNGTTVLSWTGVNIGIGTIIPSEKLEVVGNIKANNLVYNTGNQTISGIKTFNNRPTVNGSGIALTADTSKIIDKFTPSQNQPPSTGFARFDTRNSILVLDFNDTTNESGTFVGSIPDTANISNGLNVRINWSALSGTSGSCVWGARFMNLNTDLDIDSFDVAGFASGVANATNGVPTVTQITCTGINGLTTGSFYRMLVFRNSTDTVNDTMLGDAEINFIEVRTV